MLETRPRLLIHSQVLAMDIAGAPQAERDEPGSGGCVGEAIDQDEPAHLAIVVIRSEGGGLDGCQVAKPDLIERACLRCMLAESVDIKAMLERGDTGRHRLCTNLEKI